jgi:small-conductance mechanosensitive channel
MDLSMLVQGTWVVPAAILSGSCLVGLLLQRYLMAKIRSVAARTRWKADDLLIDSLRGAPFLWCVVAGLALAIRRIGLPPDDAALAGKALASALIVSGTLVTGRFVAAAIRVRASRVEGGLAAASLAVTLGRLAVLLVGSLVLFQTLGVEIGPLLTTFGVGGLAVALALQDTMSNFFAGLHVLLSGRVRKGDYIRLQSGEEGYVTEISWRDTTIRSLPNNLVVIPNGRLSSAIVTNFNHPDREVAVLVEVGVAYDSDLKKVEHVTVEVARSVMREVTGGVTTFEPFIRYHTFAESSVNFSVILRGREFVDQYLLKHEFIKRLHQRFDDEGIRIPFPMRTLEWKGVALAGG